MLTSLAASKFKRKAPLVSLQRGAYLLESPKGFGGLKFQNGELCMPCENCLCFEGAIRSVQLPVYSVLSPPKS